MNMNDPQAFSNVFLFVHPACRMHCLYCQESATNTSCDIDPNRIKDIIKILGDNKTRRIWLTGGEAILSPYILEYIQCAKDNGITPRFSTQDGRRLKEIAPSLENIHIQISFNGIYEDHDHITQVKGSFKDIEESLSHIDTNTIELSARIIIRPDMEYSINEMLSWIEDKGIKKAFLSNISPAGKAKDYMNTQNNPIYNHKDFISIAEKAKEEHPNLGIGTRYTQEYGNTIGIYPIGDIYAMPTEDGETVKLGNILQEDIPHIYDRYKNLYPEYHSNYMKKIRTDGTLE